MWSLTWDRGNKELRGLKNGQSLPTGLNVTFSPSTDCPPLNQVVLDTKTLRSFVFGMRNLIWCVWRDTRHPFSLYVGAAPFLPLFLECVVCRSRSVIHRSDRPSEGQNKEGRVFDPPYLVHCNVVVLWAWVGVQTDVTARRTTSM